MGAAYSTFFVVLCHSVPVNPTERFLSGLKRQHCPFSDRLERGDSLSAEALALDAEKMTG